MCANYNRVVLCYLFLSYSKNNNEEQECKNLLLGTGFALVHAQEKENETAANTLVVWENKTTARVLQTLTKTDGEFLYQAGILVFDSATVREEWLVCRFVGKTGLVANSLEMGKKCANDACTNLVGDWRSSGPDVLFDPFSPPPFVLKTDVATIAHKLDAFSNRLVNTSLTYASTTSHTVILITLQTLLVALMLLVPIIRVVQQPDNDQSQKKAV